MPVGIRGLDAPTCSLKVHISTEDRDDKLSKDLNGALRIRTGEGALLKPEFFEGDSVGS